MSNADSHAIAKRRGTLPARASTSRRATTPATALALTFDLAEARSNWEAACNTYDDASERYLALCGEMESAARVAAAQRSRLLKKIYREEDRLAGVIDKRDDAASVILAAPASAETLQVKLGVFGRLWTRERRAIDEPLNGGDVMDVAAGIALDLLTLLGRGEGGLTEIAKAA
jgi:hypothetical protein